MSYVVRGEEKMNKLKLVNGQLGLELEHKDGNWIMLKEYGYSPVQMLVASIGACGQYVYKSVLERSSIPGKLRDVMIEYAVDENSKSHQLTHVNIVFDIEIEPQFQTKALSALRLVNEYCPVIQSLDPKIVIEKSVNFIDF